MIPTVHLNGTSKQSLLDGWEEAYTALTLALDKLAQAAPNGRDYYPQDVAGQRPALYKAQDEHRARMQKVQSVMDDLQALCEAVAFK